MIEVIGEVGLNHQGSVDLAMRMCDAALMARCNAVKFQTYDVSQLLHSTDGSYVLLRDLALQHSEFKRLARHCEGIGIEFISTPDDVASLRFLVEEIGVKRLKIGSADLTNEKLLEEAWKTGLPLILSTGMANLDEICGAIYETLYYDRLTLLHCVSVYPCPFSEVNLQAMVTLQNEFDCRVGYSDHAKGTRACLAAAAMGAAVIEKHFMMEEHSVCVDKAVSITALELEEMVKDIRTIELMQGDGIKQPSITELFNRGKFRKGPDGKRALA